MSESEPETHTHALARNEERLANGLGWFSVGLGLAEVLAPHQVARFLGLKDGAAMIQAIGVRELASGAGILSQSRPARWMWSRVGGDLMDLGLIGAAMGSEEANRTRLAVAASAVAGIAAVDLLCAQELSREGAAGNGAVHFRKTITINRSAEDLYGAWRDFEQLPRFMNHLKQVEKIGDNLWHWTAKGPAGMDVEWDAVIINDRSPELIAWRSLPGADVDNAGTVRFLPAPGNRGTMVKVELQYHPPIGKLGARAALLLGEAPEKQIPVDLHRFKQLMETGEVATTEGQPAGRGSSTSKRFDEPIQH